MIKSEIGQQLAYHMCNNQHNGPVFDVTIDGIFNIKQWITFKRVSAIAQSRINNHTSDGNCEIYPVKWTSFFDKPPVRILNYIYIPIQIYVKYFKNTQKIKVQYEINIIRI